MGRFKLSQVILEIAKRGKMEGKVTNHSLRAKAASHLYQNNVDEQLVMETTGHRSTTSVHSYSVRLRSGWPQLGMFCMEC